MLTSSNRWQECMSVTSHQRGRSGVHRAIPCTKTKCLAVSRPGQAANRCSRLMVKLQVNIHLAWLSMRSASLTPKEPLPKAHSVVFFWGYCGTCPCKHLSRYLVTSALQCLVLR